MRGYFKDLFNKKPDEIIDNDYYFNPDNDGDQFDETDAELWLNKGIFKNRWESETWVDNELFNYFYNDVCNAFEMKASPFLEIACGPGMGLTPLILSKNPKLPCLVTDACSLLIKSWRKYINENLKQYDIDLASFNVMDMPIKSNSVDVVTSFIGISSTREGEQGKMKAINEVYRILKNDGYFIAIENEWIDFNAIEEVFKLWGKPVWNGMKEEKSWHDKFTECKLNIESCDKTFYKYLSKDDNELGEQADKFGIKIGLKYTLFILRKCTV